MQRALVIYDSKFGNTRDIATRIGEALESAGTMDVDVVSTARVDRLPDRLGLLVLGGPTQRHGVEDTMREFLERLPAEQLNKLAVAVFDTRMHWPKLLSGSAADGIAKRLAQAGAEMIDGPESFFVEDKEGPLREGELQRAAEWGHHLRTQIKVHAL